MAIVGKLLILAVDLRAFLASVILIVNTVPINWFI
jgi:hypothetical protein